MKTGFLGPAYVARSQEVALDRCINLYPEIVATENRSAGMVGAFYGTPGLDLLATVGSGPIRAVGTLGPNLYALSGTGFYQVNLAYKSTLLGSVGNLLGPATIVSNGSQNNAGNQIGVFDGSGLYAYSGGGFISVPLPFSGTSNAIFVDGFVFANQTGTNKDYQSNLYDITNWQALNFATNDGQPGPLIGIARLHNQVIKFKAQSLEPWVNGGLNGYVMERLPGVEPAVGCLASKSIATVGDNLLWVGAEENGLAGIYRMRGLEPERVSTFAIDFAIQGYSTVADAIAYGYVQEGHEFYVVSFPSGNATWCIDLTASAQMRQPMWHQRAAFANGKFSRHISNCSTVFNNKVVVGDYKNGNLYAFNLDTYLDNGAQRKWLRSFRALTKTGAEAQTRRFSWLELNMETGQNVPQGTNPQIMMRYTDDNHNWTSERFGAAGQAGMTNWRVKWNRLGMTRRGLASDRTFEISSTDPFKVALLEAEFG